jgi:hypothetical protein
MADLRHAADFVQLTAIEHQQVQQGVGICTANANIAGER